MNPFFFGSSDEPLFGAYDPAGGGRRGAVLCHPIAREYLLAYPSMRHLARKLSESGWHTLRFDYYGTGDSAGVFEEGGPSRWERDALLAIDELRDVAQTGPGALVGLRFGAVIAAMAAGASEHIERLVLWDPVIDGRAYLDEIGATWNGASGEAQGVVVTPSIRQAIQSVDIAALPHALPPTLLLNSSEDPGRFAALARHLRAHGVECEEAHVPDAPVWMVSWKEGRGRLPVRAIDCITTWLA